jgi:23S rRNA pseudouridine1911/1915/1917 synthase
VTNPPHNFRIDPKSANQRLDRFLNNQLPEHTRSYFQQLISRGFVQVNTKSVKSGYNLKPNDEITIIIPDPEPSHILPENIPINIIYEDASVIVIDKPPGLIVHPGAGHRSGTLVSALLFHCRNLSGINGVLRPGIVHRLDKNTSGLLVAAKNDNSHLFLTRQFETREIERTYQAIVWGLVARDMGQIDTLIDRSFRDRKKMSVSSQRGRKAVTNFNIEEIFRYFSLLNLTLGTGRTHQIRVHLNHINHPVFGDPEYHGRQSQINRIPANRQRYVQNVLKKMPRQALHARKLSFIHPESRKRMTFDSELPSDMKEALELLRAV